MKNLSLISFVGVDVHTNWTDLLRVQSPIDCEFSVLFSDSKSKGNYIRYPSYDFCKRFLEWGAIRAINPSLHLCGSVIERYLKQEDDVMELCKSAYRIQLNLNIANFSDYEKLADDILAVISKHGHSVILQQNKTKAKFMECFLSKNTGVINLLHDSSGGFGREITKVESPDNKHFTGYAGGISPENVSRIVDLIEKSNSDKKSYYIDMESGVRTDNIFSVEKCQHIINNIG